MDFSFFIAKRLAFSRKSSISSVIIRIAILAIGISAAAMIIAVFMIRGFQVSISEKIFGFWGHIDVIGLESSREISLSPISDPHFLIDKIEAIDTLYYLDENDKERRIVAGVGHVQQYIIYPAILSTREAYEGLLMKGVGADFDQTLMMQALKSGQIPEFGSADSQEEIIISSYTADRLQLDTGMNVILNFVTENDQIRKRVKISGIYSTGLMEYDKKLAIMDINLLREVLQWDKGHAGGLEIFLNDIEHMDIINQYIYIDILPDNLYSLTARQKFPAIFEWLKLQNINENVILLLMLIVSIINMITALLILILEQTKMIGILRALGAATWSLRKIFLYHASFIVLAGLLIGNILGLGFSILQKEYGFIKLDEANYYLSEAPVFIDIPVLVMINIGTLIITMGILIIPSYLISKIDPVRTISFR
jgi:lipoprotein-releasing system permease protein